MSLPATPQFDSALRHLEEVLRGVRTGRASPGLVESLEIDVYGTRMPLKSLATISVTDARTLQVEPWDKSQTQVIEKTISASPLGVNPVTAGTVIRIPLPALTEERRKDLTKVVRQHVEAARGALRQTREKILNNLRAQQTAGELSENEFERARKKLQAEVDAATAAVERRGEEKKQEILTI